MAGSDQLMTIRDARGRSFKQLDPVTLHVLHRYNTIEPEALEQIVEDLEPGTARMRRWLIILIPLAVALLAGLLGLMYLLGDASARADLVSTLLNPVITVPGIVCGILIPWMTARQARSRRICGVMLAHQRCPHCGYNLQGLPPDPEDGATACPECGAAWRLQDAVALPPPAQPPSRRSLVVTAVILVLTLVAGLIAFLMY